MGGLSDHDDARALAAEAGELLLALRTEAPARGLSGPALGAEGDRRSQELLAARLGVLHPGDAVLSEEARDDPLRLDADRVWIVDPLDGTREFGEAGRTDWAVHVALLEGDVLTAGAVALPARGVVLATDPPPSLGGAGVERPPVVVVSRSRPPSETDAVVEALGGRLTTLGSAGAKTMAVVLGAADVYLHSGGQHEWDSAAPVAVAAAAGLHASRIDGSPLSYNQPDPSLPDLLVCRAELAAPTLRALAPLVTRSTP